MQHDELRRRSRWLMRVMEWNDARARYPNLFHGGMPRQILAFDRVVGRLRLGDLIAVFYPTSQAHPERSEKYLGLSRVVGLRRAEREGFGWIDLETVHRFDPPLETKPHPRRVFLCCDPGWPEAEVELFRKIFAAAVAAGWRPDEPDREAEPDSAQPPADGSSPSQPPPPTTATDTKPGPSAAIAGRLFGGVDYSGDMRDPRDATWLAVVELADERLRVRRLEATGRHGLQSFLRDPDSMLMHVEAIGLDFPFGLPIAFAEVLLGGPFPEEGWWALVKKLERLTRPEYLVAIQQYRDAHGEPMRWTDERARAFSPLHRVNPDLGPMTFHGIRMIAEDRSRYAVRPFETAQGKLLLEVYPGGLTRRLSLGSTGEGRPRTRAIVEALGGLETLPVTIDEPQLRACLSSRDALDAVIAARQAALAVIRGETDRTPEQLAPDVGERVRLEGWIYGMEEEPVGA